MLCIKFCVFFLISTICSISGSKILGIFPAACYSQWLQGHRLLTELAQRGHEVTMIAGYEPENPIKNYRNIYVEEVRMENIGFANASTVVNQANIFKRIWSIAHLSVQATEKVLGNKNVQALIDSKERFDLIISLQFFVDATRGFQHHFKAPVVGVSPVGATFWVNEVAGNPSNPSYIPNVMTKFSTRMSFFDRLVNSAAALVEKLINHFYTLPKHNELMHKYFPDAPHISDLIYNTSLTLINSHISTNQPVPLLPNVIEVGGYHIEPTKELPKDIKTILDNAKNGVIYFSLGSFFKSANLPPNMIKGILEAFAGFKETILWKFEDETIKSFPQNVVIRKWLPQEDVLAHPNVKLFITHGGLLSTIETTYHGKPIVGIPLFGDQQMNMVAAVRNGYGVTVEYSKLSKETLTSALKEVLTNPQYSKNMELKSRIMKDQPVKPMDKAIYWIEYVIRCNGAPHFHSTSVELAWYQHLLLDVLLFLGTLCYLSYFAIKSVIKLLFNKRSNVSQKKKKN